MEAFIKTVSTIISGPKNDPSTVKKGSMRRSASRRMQRIVQPTSVSEVVLKRNSVSFATL